MVTTNVVCGSRQIRTKQSSAWVRRAQARGNKEYVPVGPRTTVKNSRRRVYKDRFEVGLRTVVQRRRYVAERSVGQTLEQRGALLATII
jgi:hypothetical protein